MEDGPKIVLPGPLVRRPTPRLHAVEDGGCAIVRFPGSRVGIRLPFGLAELRRRLGLGGAARPREVPPAAAPAKSVRSFPPLAPPPVLAGRQMARSRTARRSPRRTGAARAGRTPPGGDGSLVYGSGESPALRTRLEAFMHQVHEHHRAGRAAGVPAGGVRAVSVRGWLFGRSAARPRCGRPPPSATLPLTAMADEPKTDLKILVVQFLVPVYDRKGKPYPRSVLKQVQHDLEEQFDGWSLAADKPLAGAWRNPESGEVEYDRSWRYEVGIAADRLDELDRYLGGLSYHLGQKALWRVAYAGGEGKVIPASAPSRTR